ncbi:hypothetical protein ACFE04_003902 [Oxalis oulophora]
MVESFFSATDHDLNKLAQQDSITLLSGPPSSGKTSLLFQYAINSAIESQDSKVVFICNLKKLEIKPPYLSQGIDSSSDVFRQIEMKYIDDEEGLKKYFAAFHLLDEIPMRVIVDDFGNFFDQKSCHEKYGNSRGRDLAMVRTLALCRSAIDHVNEKRGLCQLLLSDTNHGDLPRLLFIYKRWIPTIFTIQGDGSGSFLLKNNNNPDGGKRKVAKFSIALQYLFLEAIYEEN